MMNIAVIGSGAREHIISHALCSSPSQINLYVIGSTEDTATLAHRVRRSK